VPGRVERERPPCGHTAPVGVGDRGAHGLGDADAVGARHRLDLRRLIGGEAEFAAWLERQIA